MFAHLNINIFLEWGQTYRSSHFLTNGSGNTLEKDHAVSTSSVDAAACLRLTEFELVRGSGGQMEAPHVSHAFKKEQRAEGVGATNSPQMERWGACGKRKVQERGL